MSWVIGLILIAVFYFYFSNKKKTTTPISKNKSSNDSQGSGKSFLPPMPSGYQIFAKNLPVAGIQHRKEEALKFAKSSNPVLSLERELHNKFDSNAIKLIGLSGSTQYFIGYLPKEISAQIIGTGMYENVKARLGRIYISNNDFLDIQYQVIGPKADKKQFNEFLSNQLADSSQKDYFKFFSLPIPNGLTAGQAEQAISEHQKSSKNEELEEWEGYTKILEEFDDQDFRDGYYLKKVSKTILMEAISQLKAQGKTYKYLSDNIDEVAERIIELKPDLKKQI
ncbi:MAG: hypothetical protein HHJ16_11295 [Polaromonas sp.]|uniref:HIRAN domain-containing protein n=1 Tax=Polaromonas sp. TaxID=1869339 RepID=UPI0017DD2356|nr:HIRAN domain-containing protein [Polaromonas sp.]NMM10842.1 hypothetical protein [Polaromonas sp.]